MTTIGEGYAGCHHGEILQGAFLDSHGQRHLGLVTLPMPEPATHAEYTRRLETLPEDITVLPDDRHKARRAAALTTDFCAALTGYPRSGGRLSLHGRIPVGLGMGSSTSDVIATIRAVAASFGVSIQPSLVAGLAVRVERACDPLMLDTRPVLFAQRHGHVLEILGRTLPPLVVLGCRTGQGQPVDTLRLPTNHYDEDDIRRFECLRAMLRAAISHADVGVLGSVSTTSAQLNQRILPKPELDTLTTLAETVGAAGVQIAHSGNVAGLLFDSRDPALQRRVRHGARLLEVNGLPTTEPFPTPPGIPKGKPWTITSPTPSAELTCYASTSD